MNELIEAAASLLEAVDKHKSPDWLCNSDHPALVPASNRLREVLSKFCGRDVPTGAHETPQGAPALAAWPTTAEEVRDFVGSNYVSIAWARGRDFHDDEDRYTLTAHDLLSAFAQWQESALGHAQPSRSGGGGHDKRHQAALTQAIAEIRAQGWAFGDQTPAGRFLGDLAIRLECGGDQRLNGSVRDYIEGMSVSVDVSTCEEDAHHRYFGSVTEVMDCEPDKHGVTLLVQNAAPNFVPLTPFKPLLSKDEIDALWGISADIHDFSQAYVGALRKATA